MSMSTKTMSMSTKTMSMSKSPVNTINVIQIVSISSNDTNDDANSANSFHLDASKRLAIDSISAALLAQSHFNHRNATFVPNLDELTERCHLRLAVKPFNDNHSDFQAASYLSQHSYLNSTENHHHSPPPIIFITTSTHHALPIIANAYHLPYIQASSSTQTDNNNLFSTHTTASTAIGTPKREAQSVIRYFKHKATTSFALLIEARQYPNHRRFLQQFANLEGIQIIEAQYTQHNLQSIATAFHTILKSNAGVIYAVLDSASFQQIMEMAFDHGILATNSFFWLFSTNLHTIANSLTFHQHSKISEAISGTAVIDVDIPQKVHFEAMLKSSQQNNGRVSSIINELIPNLKKYPNTATTTPTTISTQAYSVYDAVIAAGIAACQSNGSSILEGDQYLSHLRETAFQGVSGFIQFDSASEARTNETLTYSINNIFRNQTIQADSLSVDVLQSRIAATIDLEHDHVQDIFPILITTDTGFYDNSKIQTHFDRIPQSQITFSWVMSGFLMISCLAFGGWVYRYRNKKLIRAAQPTFLGVVLFGTFLMAASIIPTTIQPSTTTPRAVLNASCMASPALYAVGFGVVFSSIAIRAWRLNRVFQNAVEMNRVEIRPRDVIWPLVLVVSLNSITLIFWTSIAPLVWVGTNNSHYTNGSLMMTSGSCSESVDGNGKTISSLPFVSSLVIINLVTVIIAIYQSSLTSRMPSDFNESLFLTMTIFIIVEAICLLVPTMLISDDPSVDFVLGALLRGVMSIAVLGPLFISKLVMRHFQNSNDMANAWNSFISHVSHQDDNSVLNISHRSISTRESRSCRSNGRHSISYSVASHRSRRASSGVRSYPNSIETIGSDDEDQQLSSQYACTVEQLQANVRRKELIQRQMSMEIATLTERLGQHRQRNSLETHHESRAKTETSDVRNVYYTELAGEGGKGTEDRVSSREKPRRRRSCDTDIRNSWHLETLSMPEDEVLPPPELKRFSSDPVTVSNRMYEFLGHAGRMP